MEVAPEALHARVPRGMWFHLRCRSLACSAAWYEQIIFPVIVQNHISFIKRQSISLSLDWRHYTPWSSSASKVGLPPRRRLVFLWRILVYLQGLRHLEHLRHLPPPPSWPCGMSMEVFLLFWSILVDLQGLRHLGGSSGHEGDRLGWIKFNPAPVGTEAHHLIQPEKCQFFFLKLENFNFFFIF